MKPSTATPPSGSSARPARPGPDSRHRNSSGRDSSRPHESFCDVEHVPPPNKNMRSHRIWTLDDLKTRKPGPDGRAVFNGRVQFHYRPERKPNK